MVFDRMVRRCDDRNEMITRAAKLGACLLEVSNLDLLGDVQFQLLNSVLVTSLRARRKVFKSPSSFSYIRLLPYLQDIDSSNFELIDTNLPGKNMKLGNNALNMVAHGGQIVESFDVVQKSHKDVLHDALEECEQMTPADADIYSKPKSDKMLDVVVKPKTKLVLTPCSRIKMLHTPTSFTHRRLLPFLMSVAEDGLGTLKGNQSLKIVKGIEQTQQPPILSLLHQNVGVGEPKIISNLEQQDATNKKLDSPTSTLTRVDTTLDRIKISTLVSSDNLLYTPRLDIECSGSTTQLEVNPQSEAVEFYNSIKLELSLPKDPIKLQPSAT
ncbi:hypothetical protein Tco_1244253 [Tanacetum coccineum]